MDRRRALAALAAVLAAPPAQAQVKRREAPRPVAPVEVDGTRYEALPFGRARGLPQNGGYVVAVAVATGTERWIAKVYESPAGNREQDKQDVFITRLQLEPDGHTLLVENERGARFALDLDTRRSRPEQDHPEN